MKTETNIAVPKSTAQLLKIMVKPYKGRTFFFFTITFLGNLAWTASPVAISSIITRLSQTPKVDAAIWSLVLVYFLLRITDELLWRYADYFASTFKPKMIERVRTILFAATLRKPHEYFTNSSSGRIAHWINTAAQTTNDFVDTTIWNVWGRVVSMAIAAIILFFVHWSIGLLFSVWLIVLFWYNVRRGKKFARLIEKQSDETSKASGMVVDALSNNISVRVFNSRDREIRRLKQQQTNIIGAWRHSWLYNLVTNIVKGQSAAWVSTVALVLALLLFANGMVPIGGIVLFVAYFGDASSNLWQLAWALDNYYRTAGTIQNALDGLQAENERVGEVTLAANVPKEVSLSLQNVSFAYPDHEAEQVLDGVSLEIPNGRKIGVVGHSGAGKSTLVGLMLGFYEPTHGQILVNDTDIATKDPSYIRSISAYVPQDTSLFHRTIRENITYAKPNATDKELRTALTQAEALKFIEKLPKGLDTLVGERGVKLSGGQRQRIAIARAILKDAPLLLLDEATSALDSVSEQSIQKSLHTLMKNRTTLVIAHRLSTLRHLDEIIVLDKGKITEQGTHDQLLKQNGIYADLWRRQKDGFILD